MELNVDTYRLSGEGNLSRRAFTVGAIGLLLSFAGYFIDSAQFFHSYLSSCVFWVSLGLGGLFFTMLHHLVNALWSVVFRRIAETIMITLPILAIFFLPVFLGIHDLYHWSHTEAVASDPILLKKSAYLNSGFFIIRTVFYFIIWFVLAGKLYRASIAQDSGYQESQVKTMGRVSAPGMILFSLSITFAAFDWLMSLDAHWYSTIFGVYFFSGCLLSVLSFMTVSAQYLRKQNILTDTITLEHYHDLGKLMFAFIIWWAYIAFSQYFIIWYANIPEETYWYLNRWEGSWKYYSLMLLFGHFVVPFLILMLRYSKRNLSVLKWVSIWLLLMHWVDIQWLILPNLYEQGAQVSWMDATTMIGIGGMFVGYIWKRFASQATVPVNDPRLEASIKFTNA